MILLKWRASFKSGACDLWHLSCGFGIAEHVQWSGSKRGAESHVWGCIRTRYELEPWVCTKRKQQEIAVEKLLARDRNPCLLNRIPQRGFVACQWLRWRMLQRLRLVRYLLYQSTWTPRMLLEGDLGYIKSAYTALEARVRGIRNPESDSWSYQFGKEHMDSVNHYQFLQLWLRTGFVLPLWGSRTAGERQDPHVKVGQKCFCQQDDQLGWGEF